jgi:hypothetical protein
MLADNDVALRELLKIKAADVLSATRVGAQPEHLVEITII